MLLIAETFLAINNLSAQVVFTKQSNCLDNTSTTKAKQLSKDNTVDYKYDVSTLNFDNNPAVTYSDVISLKLVESQIANVLPNFNLSVTFNVTSGATTVATGATLSINYINGTGQKFNTENHINYFPSQYSYSTLSLQVTAITFTINGQTENLAKYPYIPILLSIEGAPVGNLVFNYSTSSVTGLTTKPATPSTPFDAFTISWTNTGDLGVTNYDVEWTWIESQDPDLSIVPTYDINSKNISSDYFNSDGTLNPDAIFENNATRVTISAFKGNGQYTIPTLYDGTGYIFYRVRPIQIRTDGTIKYGLWTSDVASSTTLAQNCLPFSGHETALNWQVTTSYAEEGKSKTVVQYFDGTLRARETVTKDNQTQNTIIAQTMYDYQGRPTIQVLPAPLTNTSLNGVIEYVRNLNQFSTINYVGSTPDDPKIAYDKHAAGIEQCPTASNSLISDPTSLNITPTEGASVYYSAKNNDLNLPSTNIFSTLAPFIPNANGYPYTETVYTPDNTGRIAAQGGVGADHQIGSQKETKYYYGIPDQQELDGLFGVEAGYASHYQKNMVKDANGQYSVSYVDMNGKTVATALAGVIPANLSELPSYTTNKNANPTITQQLLDESTNTIVDNNALVSNKTIVVTTAESYVFNYKLTGGQLASVYQCILDPKNKYNHNYACTYDLEITMTDACGNNIPLTPSSTLTAQTSFDITLTPNIGNLPPGEYHISKKLSINPATMASDHTDYINGINIQCTSSTLSSSITAANTSANSSVCNQGIMDNSIGKLQTIYNMMLQDLTPPYGQYAYSFGKSPATTNSKYNIFNKSAYSTTFSGPEYANPYTEIVFPTSNPLAPVTFAPASGIYHRPNSPTQDDSAYSLKNTQLVTDTATFIRNFRDNWAENLLVYHPEFPKLSYIMGFQSLISSYDYDVKLSKTNFNTANDENNTISSITSATDRGLLSNATAILNEDDFFRLGTTGISAVCPIYFNATDKKSLQTYFTTNCLKVMQGFLTGSTASTAYKTVKNSNNTVIPLSMWQVAYASVYCSSGANATNSYNLNCVVASPSFPFTFTNQTDMPYVWQAFKAMYLREKEILMDQFLDQVMSISNKSTYNKSYPTSLSIKNDISTNPPVQRRIYFDPLNATSSAATIGAQYPDTLAALYAGAVGANSVSGVTAVETGNKINIQTQKANSQAYMLAAYDASWNSILVKCPQISNLSATDQKAAIKNILTGFNTVCQSAMNNDGIALGAITTNYKNATYLDFNKVLNTYLSNHVDENCNEYMFSFPKPANVQLPLYDTTVLELTSNNGTCICSNFHTIQAAIENKYSSTDADISKGKSQTDAIKSANPLYIASLLKYLLSDYKTTMASTDIAGLITGCALGANSDVVSTPDPAGYWEVSVWDNSKEDFFYHKTTCKISNYSANDYSSYTYTNQTSYGTTSTTTLGADILNWLVNNNLGGFTKTPGKPIMFTLLPSASISINYAALLPSPISIPPLFQCYSTPDCIDITQYNTLKTKVILLLRALQAATTTTTKINVDFKTTSPPYTIGINDVNKADEVQANVLYAQCMNYYTGFSKTWQDYASFEQANPSGGTCTIPMICADEPFAPVTNTVNQCDVDNAALGTYQATEQYKVYAQSISDDFYNQYTAACLNLPAKAETLSVSHKQTEYHYTLYYYDQAGNLVKTVPPAGVDVSYIGDTKTYFSDVAAARLSGTTPNADSKKGTVNVPNHSMVTQYRYNTLNQVVQQNTLDGGVSKFWYDRLGRLVASQNAQQTADGNYSYTLYDQLGRITEVGEVEKPTKVLADALNTDFFASNDNSFLGWATSGDRKQITRTVYDIAFSPFTVTSSPLTQLNLHNRVSYSAVIDIEKGGLPSPSNLIKMRSSASFFTYDVEGNVSSLLHDYKLGTMATSEKNEFKRIDYDYDLISGKVNKVSYQAGYPDAFYHKYEYDDENRLTGVCTSSDDFKYEKDARYYYYRHGPLARTELGQLHVQGIDYAYNLQGWLKGVNSTDGADMGSDGLTGRNSSFAKDAYGYSLHYFTGTYGDYTPISGNSPFADVPTALNATSYPFKALFNGNIAAMAVNIPKFTPSGGGGMVYNYGYDQLNRLVAMNAFTGLNTSTFVHTDAYKENIGYDANGNISSYFRNGAANKLGMDDLAYFYKNDTKGFPTNQLDYIEDYSDANNYTTDIKEQSIGNYTYDKIGNLTKDNQNGVTNIEWTVSGKIKKVTKANSSISYTYDAAGNRISKSVSINGTTSPKETWYVRDAQGNVLSVYEKAAVSGSDLMQTEVHLYGSSRLGIYNRNIDVQGTTPNITTFERGDKFFELSNHLGNVLVSVTDNRIPEGTTTGSAITNWDADLATATDYYPFGMPMPGRSGTSIAGGWTSGTTIVNGVSVPTDLVVSSRNGTTPAIYEAANTVTLDPGFNTSANDDYTVEIATAANTGPGSTGTSAPEGMGGGADGTSAYRYGFNGKEQDADITGPVDYDYGFRIYNPQIGRFLSVDPLTNKYPWYTPYQFAGNKPIWAMDLDGQEEQYYTVNIIQKAKGKPITVSITKDETKSLIVPSWMSRVKPGKMGNGTLYTFNIQQYNKDGKPLPIVSTLLYVPSMMEKAGQWLENKTAGLLKENSQPFGFVETGNENGTTSEMGGTKATVESEHLDMSEILAGANASKDLFGEELGFPELLDLVKDAAKENKKISSTAKYLVGLAERLDKLKSGTEAADAASNSDSDNNESSTENKSNKPDSAICHTCSHKQDSAHIDDNNGIGTYKKLKDAKETDQTRK